MTDQQKHTEWDEYLFSVDAETLVRLIRAQRNRIAELEDTVLPFLDEILALHDDNFLKDDATLMLISDVLSKYEIWKKRDQL